MSVLYNKQVHEAYQNAHGPIPYNLMNDYMFRVVLQENEFVLRGLIGSLLNLSQGEIRSVEIKNPIKLGDQIDDKTFLLDVEIMLNNDTCLNLELQVLNEGNWTDRSLSYLCRSYDSLQHGDDYHQTKCAIHIGILDFTLFEDTPEFYASYKLMNVKNHHVFNDKFILNVLDLRQIELATDEDCQCKRDHWARLFKARTWEDLCMAVEKNQYLNAAAEEMYARNADETIRQKCRAREDYYRRQRWIQNQLESQKHELEEKNQKLAEKDQKLTMMDQKYQEALKQIEELQKQISNR